MDKQEKSNDLVKYKSGSGYRASFKHHVVLDLIRNRESESFIARKHEIPAGSLNRFRRDLLGELGYFRILEEMKKDQKQAPTHEDLLKENESLKKALELSMLKVEALEILMDVAEDQFNIDIRKKSAPKRSK
ncbi:hypothetical protein [Marinoscillum pacificum]|uniref:hypothetical protein n=1 Tax=Marinoscillum pacificum TaxID=392723 RepID=UPI0021575EB7|nr:hypothetical protein [Marinoscillum pacificum]